MKVKFIYCFLFALVIFSNCSKRIIYSFDDIFPKQNSKLSNSIFDIEIFVDSRLKNQMNSVLFNNPRIYYINENEMKCINSEKNYKKGTVPLQITEILRDHLNKKNIFKDVVINNKSIADYYLTGELTEFYGEQQFSNAASTGQMFGVIGALATANLKTKGKIIIEISNLILYDKNNQVIKDFGTFQKVYTGDFPIDGDCWYIYYTMNQKLKDYFLDLIYNLQSELKIL